MWIVGHSQQALSNEIARKNLHESTSLQALHRSWSSLNENVKASQAESFTQILKLETCKSESEPNNRARKIKVIIKPEHTLYQRKFHYKFLLYILWVHINFNYYIYFLLLIFYYYYLNGLCYMYISPILGYGIYLCII